ncbi:MAG: fluoride efflux transporter CrcB [Rhodospirillales bacterium]|nr:fluoride efflux transporter CrcB [Rhodospirillales bacterium]MCB9965176.1 fluoride efflux transporter CrcB [Rhodospirillales bacterium]MCB9973195.1 fluoride efflux transporter CrcB [Rhodospirillales bacterium]
MYSLLAIAAGGALGALCRHGVNVGVGSFLKQSFPFGTLCANVLGCFLMGLLVSVFARYGNPSQEIRLFLTVGFLGAFTTFSTFSLDAMTIYMRGEYMMFLLYVAASVILSLCAFVGASFLIGKFMV